MAKRVMSVEKLLHWAYGEQRVHLNLEGGRMLDIEGEGEGGGFCLAAVSDHSHPDALTLDRLVSGLETGRVVRKYGIAGTQPDWKKGARHRFEPKIWDVGQNGARWGFAKETLPAPDHRFPYIAVNDCGPRKRKDILEGWYDYVEITQIDAPHEVARVRAFYRDWVAGLTALRNTLLVHGDSLIDYAVNQILPLDEPWKTSTVQRILYAPKILVDEKISLC